MSIINDLTPSIVDITIPQGSDSSEFFQLYSDDAHTIPLNLSGLSARQMLRKSYNDKKVLLDMSDDNGRIWIGAKIVNGEIVADSPVNGGIALFYNHLDTTAIKFNDDSLDCVRDLELFDDNHVKRLLQGTITIIREVTR